jgi:hypothetical protein
MSGETRRVFVGRIRYPYVARVGRIKGVDYGCKAKAEDKSW